jgi:hypothetical protein
LTIGAKQTRITDLVNRSSGKTERNEKKERYGGKKETARKPMNKFGAEHHVAR